MFRFILSFILNFEVDLIYWNTTIKTMKKTMSKLTFFISVEDYFTSFFVDKTWTSRNKIIFCLNSKNLSFLFIPYKYFGQFDIIISLTKIILIYFFSLTFIKIAFCFFFFYLSNIYPSILILTKFCFTKNIIL